jgi:hypothetical protein
LIAAQQTARPRFAELKLGEGEAQVYGIPTWVLHELEAFIGKASKGDVVVFYFESLATQHMKVSGSPDVLGRSSKSEAQRVNIE